MEEIKKILEILLKVLKRSFILSLIIITIFLLKILYDIIFIKPLGDLDFVFIFVFLVSYNILGLIICFLEKNIIVFILVFLACLWFYYFIKTNSGEYSNYENWIYYNHQTIISPSIDLYIGKNVGFIKILLQVFICYYIVSFFILFCNKMFKKDF